MNNELICTPVMLPTTDIDALFWKDWENRLYQVIPGSGTSGNQHLYIVKDGRPKMGEWYFNQDRITQNTLEETNLPPYWKTVVSATDKSLSLPLIPSSFIEEWVAKQGKIDKVRVRIEHTHRYDMPDIPTLEVIILPIEDKTYSRDELRKNMLEAVNYGSFLKLKMDSAKEGQTGDDIFNDWFDDNY